MRNAYKKSRNSWEQCRFISYVLAQINSTKKLKPTDILSFTWDEEEKQDKDKVEELKKLGVNFIFVKRQRRKSSSEAILL